MPPCVVAIWTVAAPAAASAVLILPVSAASSRIELAPRLAPLLDGSSDGEADRPAVVRTESAKRPAVETTPIVLMIDSLREGCRRRNFRAGLLRSPRRPQR